MRLLLTAVALAAVVAPASALPARAQVAVSERRPVLERQVLVELNRIRTERGLEPLHAVDGLHTSAVAHSRAMLVRGFFAHDSADGTKFHDRIRRHYPARGWETWSVAENLLASTGRTDASSIVSAWLASPAHREIMLSTAWRDAGVGILYRPSAPGSFGGSEILVVTADFGFRAGKSSRARVAP